MTETQERCVIERTQQGETEAFNPVVEKYHSRIYTHIHRRVKDGEVAKDLSQEVWLRAFRGIGDFRRESAFSSWVYRIAENVCIDYFRKQQRPEVCIEALDVIDPRRIRGSHPCPSLSVEARELRQCLASAISQLPSMQKKVFLLYYDEDLSVKAIAARLCTQGRLMGYKLLEMV